MLRGTDGQESWQEQPGCAAQWMVNMKATEGFGPVDAMLTPARCSAEPEDDPVAHLQVLYCARSSARLLWRQWCCDGMARREMRPVGLENQLLRADW